MQSGSSLGLEIHRLSASQRVEQSAKKQGRVSTSNIAARGCYFGCATSHVGLRVVALMAPRLERVDRIHMFVSDRAISEQWYASVMGFHRVTGLEFWATDEGPLTFGDASGSIHLALFERPSKECRSTVAFVASATRFLDWRVHLSEVLKQSMQPVDHRVAWSLYFSDPDGNPFEITCYDYAALATEFRDLQPAS